MSSTTTSMTKETQAPAKVLLSSSARQKLLAFASLLGLMIFFSFASPAFMQTDNMVGILQATAVNGVLAIACTFVIITSGIDLSVGSVMYLAPLIAGFAMRDLGIGVAGGLVVAVLAGGLLGAINAAAIVGFR